MRKKMYWGIVTLILLLGVFCVFLFIKDRAEIQQLKEELAESNKLLEEQNKEKNEQPPLARDGFKMVQHDDHWHEVPIDAPDTGQGETGLTASERKVVYPHQALLDTHPVAALRAQARDSGHWSEKYIPPFPPDDAEANELARAVYIYIDHFRRKGFTDDDPETQMPEISEAREFIHKFRVARGKAISEAVVAGGMGDARWWDLGKLTWADRDSLHIRSNRLNRIPSNFNNQGGVQ